MAHTTLKKKIMAATVAMTMTLGTTAVVAPQASAQIQGAVKDVMFPFMAYEQVPNSLQVVRDNRSHPNDFASDYATWQLIGTGLGPGWCIDTANLGKFENLQLRKLTGQSGAYGGTSKLHSDIRIAAINATREMLDAYEKGDSNKVKKLNHVLQALLSNSYTALNDSRQQIYQGTRYTAGSQVPLGPVVNNYEFTQLTGFKVIQDTKSFPAYRLQKVDSVFNKIQQTVGPDEYITVLVPTGYTLEQKGFRDTPQRLITIEQPGLNPKTPPTPTPPPVTNVPAPTPTPPPPSITEIPAPTPETKTSVVTTTATTTSVKEQPPVTTTREVPVTKTITVTEKPEPTKPAPSGNTIIFNPVVINNNNTTIVNDNSNKVVLNIGGDLTVNVTEGKNLVNVTNNNGNIVIVANDGMTGDVTVKITNNKTGDTYIQNITINNIVNEVWNITNIGEPKRIDLPSGADWEVPKGGEFVQVEKESGKLIVRPKPGSDGKPVQIVVTNRDGSKTVYNITININVAGNSYFEPIYGGGSHVIKERGEYEIVQGGHLITVRKDENGQLIVVGDPDKSGDAVIVITDEYGVKHTYKFGVYATIRETHSLTSDFDLTFSYPNGWTYNVTKGSGLIEVREKNGQLVVTGKENANGTATIEIRDEKRNLRYVYTFTVTPGRGTEIERATIDNLSAVTVKKGYWTNTLRIVENQKNINVEGSGASSYTINPKAGQTGLVVIEERDLRGKLVKRYEIEVVDAVVKTIPHQITTDEQAVITGHSDIEIVEGKDKVSVVRNGNTWILSPREGQTGTVLVSAKDSQGRTTLKYQITIVEAEKKIVPEEIQIPDNSVTRIRFNQEFTYTITEGEQWITHSREGSELVIRPKDGSAGKVVRIDIKDRNGVVVGQYVVKIVQGPRTTVFEYEHTLTVNSTVIVHVTPGNQLVPTKGGELVIIKENNGAFEITPKPGSKGGELILEERDNNGNIITIHKVKVPGTETTTTPATTTVTTTEQTSTPSTTTVTTSPNEPSDKPSTPPTTVTTPTTIQRGGEDPSKTGTIEIIKRNPDGSITINPPFKGGSLTIEGPNAGDYKIVENSDGTFTIIRKGGTGDVPTNLKLVWKGTDSQGNNITINNVTINITNTKTNTNPGGGSSDNMPPECIAAISLLSLPLLVAIPLGILSQVQVPGFEAAHAQLNAAIREINNNIQQGLGIFNEDKAGAAARADDVASQIAPMIGAVGTAIAAIAAIAGIGYGVLKACKVIPEGEGSGNRQGKPATETN